MVGMRVSFVFALAMVFASVSAQCTPQTCNGPVQRRFDSSMNCTGTAYTRERVNGPLDVCQEYGSRLWKKETCDSTKGFVSALYADADCSVLISANSNAVGQCISGSSGYSELYLCNVNDTFVAGPQSPADSSRPIFSGSSYNCGGLDNCTRDTEVFFAYYRNDDSNTVSTCAAANATSFWGTRASANFSLNTCFYDSNSLQNIKVTCTNDYLIYSYYQNDQGCQGTAISADMFGRGCGLDTSSKKRDFWTSTIYCASTVPEEEVVPSVVSPAPTGKASSISLGHTALAFVALALFLVA